MPERRTAPSAVRIALLMQEYGHFLLDGSMLGERLQALELLRRQGREVHRVADDAVLEEVADGRRRFDADELLPLARRRGDVGRGDHLRKHLQALVRRRLGEAGAAGRIAALAGELLAS